MNQPVIKWTGSKRSQSQVILKYFPKQIDCYYEAFIGGGAILKALLGTSDIEIKNYICSDINSDLINLWNMIKENPDNILLTYEKLWNTLNSYSDIKLKKQFFYEIRQEFNKTKQPELFFFLMRTVTNGMPRYNKEGDFNSSFHITRNGILPKHIIPIMEEWNKILVCKNVLFKCCDYNEIKPNKNDFCYFDPPYANTKGMYYGGINNEEFFTYLKNLNCDYLFSFDGKSGAEDNTFDVPKEIYNNHIYIKSGNSSFKRTLVNKNDSIVFESLYIKKERE